MPVASLFTVTSVRGPFNWLKMATDINSNLISIVDCDQPLSNMSCGFRVEDFLESLWRWVKTDKMMKKAHYDDG